MTRKLLLSFVLLAIVAGCTGKYSGYRSKCACDFEAFDPIDAGLV